MTKHELAIEAAVRAVMETNMPFSRGVGGLDAVLPTAIAAYQRVMRDTGEGEVRVRAAVCVSPKNGVLIYGNTAQPEKEMRRQAHWLHPHTLDGSETYCWAVLSVPAWRPPAEETVEGEVVG